MPGKQVLIVGSGHLARRIRTLASARGYSATHLHRDAAHTADGGVARSTIIERSRHGIDLASHAAIFLVGEHDDTISNSSSR